MKNTKLYIIILLVGIVAWAIITGNLPLKNDDTRTSKTTASVQPVKKAKAPDIAGLTNSINQITAQHSDLDTSIAITDLQTNKTYQYGDTAAYTAASINKLVTAMAYINKVEQGNATLSQYVGGEPAQTQIEKALVNSDNAAWESFYTSRQLSCAAHNEYAQSIGLTSYDCVSNVISASDVALLLTRLYKGELASKTHTDLILGYLKQANYREYIVSAVPNNLTVYHKVGYLTDRVHDGAIVTDSKDSYVLVIFTKATGTYNTPAAIKLFQDITKATTKTFLDK